MPPATIETRETLQPIQDIPAGFQPTLEAIQSLPETYEQANRPQAINVAEMPGDSECRANAKANLMARKAGDVALGGTVETKVKPIRNTKEGLNWAAAGDEEGIEMIDSNIIKEMSEYLYKVGLSKVKLGVDSQNRILQHGQLMQDVYRNGYQLASAHPVLEVRSRADGNNGARLEHLNEQGLLNNHTMVAFSRTSDGMSDEELDELNFFSATKSLSIQATTKGSEGLQTETAFVAGVPEDGAERVDKEMVEAIYEHFGVDCRGKTAEELLDMPLLIPNEYMEDGVVDLVKLYDDIFLEKHGVETFFGQIKPKEDYLEYQEFCEARERNLESDKVAIRQQLIAENEDLAGAVDVSKRLAKTVQDKLVSMAIKDESIDERVFGAESAGYISQVRAFNSQGDYEQAARYAQLATSTASGGSCPSSLESLAKLFGLSVGIDDEEERKKKGWHGYDDEKKAKKGTCVNCKKDDRKVGIKGYCKNCISC